VLSLSSSYLYCAKPYTHQARDKCAHLQRLQSARRSTLPLRSDPHAKCL